MRDAPLINILLADDDKDDCLLFGEALEELKLHAKLTEVYDGEQLMRILTKGDNERFHILFLDLNMPRKNGFVCLEEIKHSEKLRSLPVIIVSTSEDENITGNLYKQGAEHFICKPADFFQLKRAIEYALQLVPELKALLNSKGNNLDQASIVI